MSPHADLPVIIAGGGPTGMMLATELGLAGVPTIVVERLREASGWSRSLTLQARSAEVLRYRGLNWFTDYPRVRSYNFGLLELTDLIDPSRIPLLVPQRDLERRLEDRAVELGVDIRRGCAVEDMRQDTDGVTVRVRSGGGDSELRGAYLVGCDGGSSRVRKLAGIGFPGSSSTIDGITGDVRTAADVVARLPPTLYDSGLFAITPLGPGLFRVTVIEFGVPLTSRETPVAVAEFLSKIHRVSGIDLDIFDHGEASWLSRFGNPTRLAERYRAGRVLLAGDSAHIHLPVSGQGLNTGLQDAFNLGWKLAATWHGWAPPELLDSYHSERHPVGDLVCMNTAAQDVLMYPLGKVAPLRELFADLLRLPDVNRYVTDMVTGLGIRYPMPESDSADVPQHEMLGGRVPDFSLRSTVGAGPESSVSATLHSGRGVLLDLSAGSARLPAQFGWADRVDVVIASAPVADAVLLLRPDGYVAHADRDGADADGLTRALRTWFGEPDSAGAANVLVRARGRE